MWYQCQTATDGISHHTLQLPASSSYFTLRYYFQYLLEWFFYTVYTRNCQKVGFLSAQSGWGTGALMLARSQHRAEECLLWPMLFIAKVHLMLCSGQIFWSDQVTFTEKWFFSINLWTFIQRLSSNLVVLIREDDWKSQVKHWNPQNVCWSSFLDFIWHWLLVDFFQAYFSKIASEWWLHSTSRHQTLLGSRVNFVLKSLYSCFRISSSGVWSKA